MLPVEPWHVWVLGTHTQPGKYHPGLSPRHWVRDISSSPISLCEAASPQSLTPPSPVFSRGEWRQGTGAIPTGCLGTQSDTQGDTGVHRDITLQLGAGDGAELPCVLGGPGSRWMGGRGCCIVPSHARRSGGSGRGNKLAGSQRGAGAGSSARTGAGGAGAGKARLPSAPRLQAAPFRESWGQTPARSHRTRDRLRPLPKDNTRGWVLCHPAQLGGGRDQLGGFVDAQRRGSMDAMLLRGGWAWHKQWLNPAVLRYFGFVLA